MIFPLSWLWINFELMRNIKHDNILLRFSTLNNFKKRFGLVWFGLGFFYLMVYQPP